MKRFLSVLQSVNIAGDWNIADKTLTAGIETIFGEYLIKAGERIQIGGGYVYVVPQTTTSTRIEGLVRIYLSTPFGSRKLKVVEFHTGECQTFGDKMKMKWLDPQKLVGQQDRKLTLEITADATADAVKAKSIAYVPCIKYDLAA